MNQDIRKLRKSLKGQLKRVKQGRLTQLEYNDRIVAIKLYSDNKYYVCFDYNELFGDMQQWKLYTKHNAINMIANWIMEGMKIWN